MGYDKLAHSLQQTFEQTVTRSDVLKPIAWLTAIEEAAFFDYIKSIKLGWFHRIANSWMLYSSKLPDSVDADAIRDKLMEIKSDNGLCVVLEVGAGDWAGFFPKSLPGSLDWVNDHWLPE